MIPLRKDLEKFFNDEQLAIKYFYDKNILCYIPCCPVDGSSMKQISSLRYKCRKKTHRKIYSALTQTIFKNLQIKINDLIYLMHMWICEVSVKSILLLLLLILTKSIKQ